MDFPEQTIQLLYRAIKRAVVDPGNINTGDRIVVTGDIDDIEGIVEKNEVITDDIFNITLKTSTGTQTFQISNKNYIHIIQRADMLNMRNHTDYNRDLEDVSKDAHKYTEKDRHPIFGPVEKSDKSTLPSSKISLVMKNKGNSK